MPRTLVVIIIGLSSHLTLASARAAESAALPPGWLPVNHLDDKGTWADFRKYEKCL